MTRFGLIGSALGAMTVSLAAQASDDVFVSLLYDPERSDDGLLCQHKDGRVFVTLASQMEGWCFEGDDTALLAINRAWQSNQALFAGPITPRRPAVEPAVPGMSADLTEADRARLYAIIDKYWRFYFAERPTNAQKDNLIDALGPKVASDIVKKAVDGGKI